MQNIRSFLIHELVSYIQEMAETKFNVTGFTVKNNATNRSLEQFDDQLDDIHYTDSSIFKLYIIIWYVVLALGVPGNVLSAIVWLRRGIASNNSSAVYLAALAIEDFAFLMFGAVYIFLCDDHWLCQCCLYILTSASDLESLLVLGFSVERLIAILRPLQVRRNYLLFRIQNKQLVMSAYGRDLPVLYGDGRRDIIE